MTFPKSKVELIDYIIDHIVKYDNDPKWTIDKHKFIDQWFLTKRSGFSFRLTLQGSEIMKIAGFKGRDFIIEDFSYIPKVIHTISRKLNSPYFLFIDDNTRCNIRVYDEELATIIGLHGTLGEFLKK